jgi:hypothetical protein
MNRLLVCIVKSGSVSSTIKALEPIEQQRGNKKQPVIRKLLQSSQDSLRVFKEFYVRATVLPYYEILIQRPCSYHTREAARLCSPGMKLTLPRSADSIHFLKSKLCVGGSRGFEIVDLETLDTQGLLDPSDMKLDFVQKREGARPLAIFRIDTDFLLCYQEFAFCAPGGMPIERSLTSPQMSTRTAGERERTGSSTGRGTRLHSVRSARSLCRGLRCLTLSPAFHYPYVLAFEPTFVEVRHVGACAWNAVMCALTRCRTESGALMQIIPGTGIRHLFSDTPASTSSSSYMAPPQPYYPGQPGYANGHYLPPGAPRPGFRAGSISTTRSQIIFCADHGGTICRFKLVAPPPPPPLLPGPPQPLPPHHHLPHPHAHAAMLPPQPQPQQYTR